MDYEKFVSTLSKFKIEALFTKRRSSISGDNICACFEYKDSIDKAAHLEPSFIASITNSLDKENKLNSWLISSNNELDPAVYKSILDFALLKDDQKIIKLENCLDKK